MKRKAYVLKGVLPHGTVFPFYFGSIPGTVADDGDPVDALVLIDEPRLLWLSHRIAPGGSYRS